jgi:predicted phage baseplate assembly protein
MSAAMPNGVQSTLEIRVNDLLWKEVQTLYGHGPDGHIYIIRIDDDGKTTVQFGDGYTGARLPTGRENVRATYRKGIGLGGLVKAGQLKLLMTRPLGAKDVINPLDTEGADDPETLGLARINAPLKVLTLDRIVSLKDYEEFARSFTGIAKALATWTWTGERRSVFLTVAGPKGALISKESNVYKNLLVAVRNAGDPDVLVHVESYEPKYFRISGSVKSDPAYIEEKVLKEIETALRSAFSFNAREFGQPVTLSEVIAVIQNVKGVVAVDIDRLYLSATSIKQMFLQMPTISEISLNKKMQIAKVGLPHYYEIISRISREIQKEHPSSILIASIPQPTQKGDIKPAELLTLDPAPIALGVMQ